MGVGPESFREQSSVDGVIETQDLVTGRRVPLGDHLANIGASPELISTLVRSDGSFGYRALLPDLHNVTPDDLQQHMLAAIKPVHEGINAIFNEPTLGGRSPNDHGPRHIRAVATTAKRLAQEAGYDHPALVATIISAHVHDLGNIVSREDHASISAGLALKIFPQLPWYPRITDDVLKAVALHDGDVRSKALRVTSETPHADLIEQYRKLGKSFSPLVIADKAHIGPDRLPDKPLTREELNDIHASTNWNGRTNHVGLAKDGKTFMWWVGFDQKISEAEAKRHPELVHHEGNGQYTGVLSRRMEWQQAVEGESAFTIWARDIRRLRHDSLLLMAGASFSMHPQQERFIFLLNNNSGESTEREKPHIVVFRRESIDDDIRAYQEKYGLSGNDHNGSYHPNKITT